MAFKKGQKPWNKGKKCPQISDTLRGTKRPDLSKRNIERAQNRVKLICPCGKDFYILQRRIKKGVKYCSPKCYHKFTNHARAKGKHWKLSKETRIKQGLHQLKDKNHNWKGGYFRGKYIGIPQSKEFARLIFKRDNYCCQICGNNGRKAKLNAHHLNSVNHFPGEAGNINNGITLCQECHRRFHDKYGYGKNTKGQFEKFTLEKIEIIKKVNLKNSVIYNLTLEGEDSFYVNGILTHNTPPHVITPKNKKALKFEWTEINGKMESRSGRLQKGVKKSDAKQVFFKKVKHPGTRPNPFVRTMIHTKLKKIIIQEMQKAQI